MHTIRRYTRSTRPDALSANTKRTPARGHRDKSPDNVRAFAGNVLANLVLSMLEITLKVKLTAVELRSLVLLALVLLV